MNRKSAAIMQPTFLPWVGYFALMDSVDEFVFLDDVQFDKRSWQQRNRIKTANGPLWLTVPVRTKGLYHQLIKDVKIDLENRDFPHNHIRSIQHNYSKAPWFDTMSSTVLDILAGPHESLCDLNIALTLHIKEQLGIGTATCRSSAFGADTKKTGRLAEICQKLGAGLYVSPPGSRSYLDAELGLFAGLGIEVRYFEYEHPVYRQQFAEFQSHMSALDLLFNEGPGSMNIIRSGIL
jgi:hypothetical protein